MELQSTLATPAPFAAPATPLNGTQKKTLALASLGGALEFYDFIIFVFWAPVISRLFFPSDSPEWLRQLQTFGIFAVGYMIRPLGGIVMAHFGDLIGRKRMFTLSVLMMAVPTLAMGLLPTYATAGALAPVLLVICRVLQGIAVGGEVPGAFVFASEHVPRDRVALSCGLLQGGLTSGVLLGSLATLLINRNFSSVEVDQFAWRIPFIIGGIFGFLSVYLRQWLEETPVFVELKKRKALEKGMPLGTVLKHHRRGIIVSMMLTWALSATIVVVVLMTPTLLQKQFGVSPATTLSANLLATVGLVVGSMLSGWAAGRFGARPVIIIGSIAQAALYYGLMATTTADASILIPLYGLTGLAVGVVGAYPFVWVKAFPGAVRFSGISFSYNVAYAIFGGVTPILISWLGLIDRVAPAWYIIAISIVAIVTTFFIRDVDGYGMEERLDDVPAGPTRRVGRT